MMTMTMTMITIAMVFEMMMMVVVVVVMMMIMVMDDDDDDDDDAAEDEVYNLITFTDLGGCYSPRPDRDLRWIISSSISLIKYSSNDTQPHSVIAKYKAH